MRLISMLAMVLSAAVFAPIAGAASEGDVAQMLDGPWGRVDFNWQPYGGALSKNSCPVAGVSRPSAIGLFGEGGSIWIEAGAGGSLTIHDGGPSPRALSFVRFETGSTIVYRDIGGERRLSLAGADRLSDERLPATGAPGTKYLRCKKKKS